MEFVGTDTMLCFNSEPRLSQIEQTCNHFSLGLDLFSCDLRIPVLLAFAVMGFASQRL